jgi:oligoribonuclease NrnB/cAMP/cGMP phosphodiesterase (DHH superfamily)
MDGLAAAAVARQWAGEQIVKTEPWTDHNNSWIRAEAMVDVRQCDYGAPIDVEDARGKTVIVTDFAFPPETMQSLRDVADRFIWLDHHESNAALAQELKPFAQPDSFKFDGGPASKVVKCVVVFDVARSGAGIAWDVLFPGKERPWIVSYVEDRDLWRFKLPYSRAVNLYVQSMPKQVDSYANALRFPGDFVRAIEAGCAMESYVEGWVETTADAARLIDFLEWKNVPIVTCTYSGIADVLERMLVKYQSPVALAWLQRKDGLYQYSLRSDGSVDVSEVAKRLGGGGHVRAAGFQSRTIAPWECRMEQQDGAEDVAVPPGAVDCVLTARTEPSPGYGACKCPSCNVVLWLPTDDAGKVKLAGKIACGNCFTVFRWSEFERDLVKV